MRRRNFRRGVVLLQTLVTSVILSMIAVMVLKWVLGRYMLAARNYRSTVSKAHTQGVSMQNFSAWNFNTGSIPASGSSVLDSKTISYTTSGPASMRTFQYSVNQDQ